MVLPLAAGLGLLSFGASALGAVGQHQSASAAARAQNEAAISNHKYKLKVRENNWRRERERYAAQKSQYQQETGVGGSNQLAAQRAQASNQQRLNNIYKKAGLTQQAQLVKLAQGSGLQAAAGRRGRSATRLDTNIVSQFGRNQAIMAESLLGAQFAARTRNDTIGRELMSANNQAFSNVAYAPEVGVAPPAPVMRSGPSGLGLMAGLMSAAVDGAGAYKQFGGTGLS